MSKKMIVISCVVLFVILLGLGAFIYLNSSKNNAEGVDKPTIPFVKKTYTSEEIANELKKTNLPIEKIVVFNEDTDPNKVMGRPGEYTSKTSFTITGIEELDADEPDAGTIEVFSNKDDAKKRHDYIKSINESDMGSLTGKTYLYLRGKYFFRISYDVKPEDAKKFEDEFLKIVK